MFRFAGRGDFPELRTAQGMGRCSSCQGKSAQKEKVLQRRCLVLQGEVTSLNCALHKERGVAQAAEEKAQACVQQMRQMELQYQSLLEVQDAQLRKLRVSECVAYVLFFRSAANAPDGAAVV